MRELHKNFVQLDRLAVAIQIFCVRNQSSWSNILEGSRLGCIFTIPSQGTWEHGNRQGQCRIEKNNNGVAFIDGNYQDDKMNGKVCSAPHWQHHCHLTSGGGEIPGRHLAGRLFQGWDSPRLLSLLWLQRPSHLCWNAQKRKTFWNLLEGEFLPAANQLGRPGNFWHTLTNASTGRTLEKVKIFRRWFTAVFKKEWLTVAGFAIRVWQTGRR